MGFRLVNAAGDLRAINAAGDLRLIGDGIEPDPALGWFYTWPIVGAWFTPPPPPPEPLGEPIPLAWMLMMTGLPGAVGKHVTVF